MGESFALSVRGIVKRYPGVTALDNIALDIKKEEIHAICGENGAGKSTLIKILTGAIQPDEGILEIDGITRKGFTPHEAMFHYGIAAIYQEFNLVPYLSIAENIFLGNELRRKNGLLNIAEMNRRASECLEMLGITLDPRVKVEYLTVAYQQIVEIAKAISHNVKILIMDEPSAPLSTHEVEKLFTLIRNLKSRGVTIVYISHRMSEIFDISDRVTVFRDGKLIQTFPTRETDKKTLIRCMVGRELLETFPERTHLPTETVLQVEHLSRDAILKDISFSVRAGEILGFGGLVGAGRTELVRAVFGADRSDSGTVMVKGKQVSIKKPAQAVKYGLGLIPEDRKRHGIISELSVKENISYSAFHKVSRFGLLLPSLMKKVAETYRNLLNIVCPGIEKKIKDLSGGNQQKVVLARWLATGCDILLFDEPTRGIDVGAKQEIYRLINSLAAEGKALILISSEMPELLGMSDRIIVMHEGQIAGELSRREATQEKILQLASGE
ncbi:MAG: sugar ABC transporter ATP-binding protein [Spirochaetales bacterium]|nr:sugar ABC transporter ATP-binding protein [Spirochaetales bacterium]